MKNRIRLMSILLVLGMLLGALSACGNDAASEAPAETSSAAPAEEAAPAGEDAPAGE